MLHLRFVRYLLVGGLCSCIFVASGNFAFWIYPQEWIATIVSNVCGILCGYFLQMRITFEAKGNLNQRFVRYLVVSALSVLYAQVLTFCCVRIGISYFITSVLIAITIPFFSYPLQKFWVFGEKNESSSF